MRTLLILRHGKSGHDDGLPDEERTLTERGRKASRRIGAELARRDGVPGRILWSTSARTRETVAQLLKGLGAEPPVEYFASLYLGEPSAYLEALVKSGGAAERVMVVGHNPGLESLTALLTGERVELPTAALAECVLHIDNWSELTADTHADLGKVWLPRDLD